MPIPTAPFDPKSSIYAGMSVIRLAGLTALAGVTATTAGVFTSPAHGLKIGNTVHYVGGTGGTGLVVGNAYYVVETATADTFKLSATPGGTALTITAALSAGSFDRTLVFESKKLDSDLEQELQHIELPDAKGVSRRRRSVLTSSTEFFLFDTYEVKRILEIFGGKLAGRVTAKCTLWIPDPDDDSGKVSLKSQNNFPVTITRNTGAVTFGDGNFSQTTIRIESNADDAITWERDIAA